MFSRASRYFVPGLLLCLSLLSQYTIADERFAALEPELQARYESLTAEFRCPKCLNTNIADSNAPISADLRLVVRELLIEGYDDRDIREHMRERFGDFVLYNPPISPGTVILWVTPIVLLLIAVLVLLNKRGSQTDIEITDEERQKLQFLKQK